MPALALTLVGIKFRFPGSTLCLDEVLVRCYSNETIDDTVYNNQFSLSTALLYALEFGALSTLANIGVKHRALIGREHLRVVR